MKRTLASALFLTSLFAVGAASAQEHGLTANVPFEFTVGTRLLPAGTYTVTSPSSGVVQFQSADKHIAAMTTTSQQENDPAKGNKLVFSRYGDQYFLRDVLSPTAASLNVHVPRTRLEKQVQRQEAMLGGGQPVLIAAR
jgi:hypothetical protein